MKNTLFVLLIFFSFSAMANLYECKEGEAKPVLIENTYKASPGGKYEPSIFPKAEDPKVHEKNLKPFLIYYVVDSPEPYMKLTVKYEIAALRKSCESSKMVNFVAFLNSAYTEKNQFIVCKNGDYKNVDISTYPKFDSKLKVKHEFIRTGDHTSIDRGPMNYLVSYKSHLNEAFGKFPLAHPDFLFDLVKFVTTESEFFPSKQFMPFLNLKSHGSKKNVLSGLVDCQIRAKTLSQEDKMKDLYSTEEINFLMNEDFSENFAKANALLEKLGLGDSVAVGGTSLGSTHLGSTHLGSTHLGSTHLGSTHLSTTVSGLGSSNGLGSDMAFGLEHIGLSAVFAHLFKSDSDNVLGFAMLESCETDREVEFFHATLDNVLGIYSAKHSLWYRNLNWAPILIEANGSTSKLFTLLKNYTGKIENIAVE